MTRGTGEGMPPPGWHPDPHGEAAQRWWDGGQWTAHTLSEPPPASPAPRKRHNARWWVLGAVAAVVAILVIGAAEDELSGVVEAEGSGDADRRLSDEDECERLGRIVDPDNVPSTSRDRGTRLTDRGTRIRLYDRQQERLEENPALEAEVEALCPGLLEEADETIPGVRAAYEAEREAEAEAEAEARSEREAEAEAGHLDEAAEGEDEASGDGAPATLASDRVARSDLGDEWPLTDETGIVVCERLRGNVSLTYLSDTTDAEYALNGVAARRGFPPIDPVWADNPHIDGLKVSLSPLISYGLQYVCP